MSKRVILFNICILCTALSYGQEKDTIEIRTRYKFIHDIFTQYLDAITVDPPNPSATKILSTKSENIFTPHEGKVIRKIELKHFGFEKSFRDTSSTIDFIGTRILNALHNDTKGWVIRDNLFIKENTTVNAYKLADNERHLRQLSFIQDARILVREIKGNPDSVDIEVVTKDFFTITAYATALKFDKLRARIRDENFAGMGQRIQITSLFDNKREPSVGYEAVYSKNNVAGTFVNATLGYTLINSSGNGRQEEKSYYFSLDKPIISPYTRITGAFTISHNSSYNLYNTPDSLFFKYRSESYDTYLGYNLDASQQGKKKSTRRNRRFIGARYFKTNFIEDPYQFENKISGFNDRQAFLGQFTFFKEEFFKTQYIYGFGTTEDLPYGYNISLISGYHKQSYLERPYAGVDLNRYVITSRHDFLQLFFRAGAFSYDRKFQDASLLLGATMYSRLFSVCNLRMRQYARLSYSQLFNQVIYEPLFINNPFGIRDFNYSPFGNQRLTLNTESFLFLSKKWLGFQFSPFVFADLSALTPLDQKFGKSQLYTSLGGGMRTRNENFIFGTIELRLYWFPRNTGSKEFKISLRSNIRFRYKTTYVNPPSVLQLNYE